jgi:uncharacterized membrane protein YhfC
MDVLVRALSASLMLVIPIALGIFLARRWQLSWRLYAIGALTFIASQILHLPFNHWVLNPLLERLGLDMRLGGLPLAGVALLVGLSSGFFEETARYIVYSTWLRDTRRWRQALMFGAGHGGIEAILLAALALLTLAQALALRGADLASVVPAEQVELARSQLATYWAAPWHLILLGAVERVGAICLHVGLAVFVLQAFLRGNKGWLAVAVLGHSLFNAGALIIVDLWGPYAAEVFVVLAGLACLGLAWSLRGPQEEPAPAIATTVEPLQPPPSDPYPPTAEQLEDSRYA